MKSYFLILLGWFVVAFGQPAWMPWLAPAAACLGYALFWREAVQYQKRFWMATLWFVMVQAIQLSWMTAYEFQGYYILFVYAGICLWLGVQFGVLTVLIDKIPLMATAAVWTLFEWVRLHVLCGFSWNPSGLALTAYLAPLQFASVFGVLGLSFWVILTNLAAWRRKGIAWTALALFPYLFGAAHLAWHEKGVEKSSKLSVGLVQTGLLPSEKIPVAGRLKEFIPAFEQWRRIMEPFYQRDRHFDLVVLPEYAVPFSAEAKVYSYEKTKKVLERALKSSITALSDERVSNAFWLQELSTRLGADVIAGLDSSEGREHYAAAFHFSPSKAQMSRYEKRVLVPLAEYIPFPWLKRFTAKYGIVEFFTHGKEAKVFSGKVPMAVSICYEETFSQLMREGRLKGAELFVNVTNDGWYPNSRLPQQHFDHAKVRAVENGTPLVRACNTGVTAAVDSLGRVIGKIAEERRLGILSAEVPTYNYKTLYTFWGDWGIVVLSLLLLGICWKHLACWKSFS